MTLNNLKPAKRFLVFFAIFGCGAHFKGELRRNGWRKTKTACERELLMLSRVSRALLQLLVTFAYTHSTPNKTRRLTRHTLVSSLQVHGELSETWSGLEQVAVRYKDVTRRFAGARSVGVLQHVRVTAETVWIEVLQRRRACTSINTLANAHASKPGRCHDDHVTMTTPRTERF